MTLEGDQVDAYKEVLSPDCEDAKLHLNSVTSEAHEGDAFHTAGLNDFYHLQLYKYINTCAFIRKMFDKKFEHDYFEIRK